MLVFWAYTINFSTVKQFGAVESGPVEVYARELGTNIPRSKVFKMYRGGDIALRSRDKIADIPETFAALGTAGPLNTVSRTSLAAAAAGAKSPSAAAAAAASTSTSASAAAPGSAKEMTPLMFQLANLDKAASAISCPSVIADCFDVETEAVAPQAVPGDAGIIAACSDSTELTSQESFSAASELSVVPYMQVDVAPVAAEAMMVVSEDGSEGHTNATVSKDYFLSPNEPVFIGTKKYSELFTFWQVL